MHCGFASATYYGFVKYRGSARLGSGVIEIRRPLAVERVRTNNVPRASANSANANCAITSACANANENANAMRMRMLIVC